MTTALADMKINNLNHIKIFDIEKSQERMVIMNKSVEEKIEIIKMKVNEIINLGGIDIIPPLYYYTGEWEEEDLDCDIEDLDAVLEQIKRIYSL